MSTVTDSLNATDNPLLIDKAVKRLFTRSKVSAQEYSDGLESSGLGDLIAAIEKDDFQKSKLESIIEGASDKLIDELTTAFEKTGLSTRESKMASAFKSVSTALTTAFKEKDFIDMLGTMEGGLLKIRGASGNSIMARKYFGKAHDNILEYFEEQISMEFGERSKFLAGFKKFRADVSADVHTGIIADKYA